MRLLLLISIIFIFFSCKEKEKMLTAQQIIDKTIENAGGSNYKNVSIAFTFRNIQYTNNRNNGLYELTRSFTDSIGEIRDVLTNTDFERFVNEVKIELPDSTALKHKNSLNSVHYFVQLPFGLNAPSVKKELVGEADIDGKEYYEIKVTFAQEGGVTDHEDEYLYWIAKDNFTADFFAYKFYTNKGGIRFRKAYNPQIIKGIRFVDYKNYKLESWKNVNLKTIDSLYKEGKLQLLSEIKTENIVIK